LEGDHLVKKPEWDTFITQVEPDKIVIAGYLITEIIREKTFLETVCLLIQGHFPDRSQLKALEQRVFDAMKLAAPEVDINKEEELSRKVSKFLLLDEPLAYFAVSDENSPLDKTIFCLGRILRCLASIFGNESVIENLSASHSFSHVLYRILTGRIGPDQKQERVLEAMVVSCADHGVTAPSAQITIIAASTRTAYEVAVTQGISAITEVHGGAGAPAAAFFQRCIEKAEVKGAGLPEVIREIIVEFMEGGKRIPGLGHRIHRSDPRQGVLRAMALETGVASECVHISKAVTEIFQQVRGRSLPLNVDGIIGAIVADMALDLRLAKALFICGRMAGLSAHYFEEIALHPPMRRVDFSKAVYKGRIPGSLAP